MRLADLSWPLRARCRVAFVARAMLCAWLIAAAGTAAQSTPGQSGKAQAARERRVKRFLMQRTGRDGVVSARAFDAAKHEHLAMLDAQVRAQAAARGTAQTVNPLSATWAAVGPSQVASRNYGNVTGRVTSIAIDPGDASGNTVYVGTTGAGVWKSLNAAGPANAVTFAALTDTLPVFSAGAQVTPSLSIGAVAVSNGVVLAGTGDPNDATDSYYGAGILRSADGGFTWTLAQGSQDGVAGNHDFIGLSVAGIAFSTVNPSIVVAAISQAVEGSLVNAGTSSSVKGLYVSTDAGLTWKMATIEDGSQIVQSAQTPSGNAVTAVVWNGVRHRFYAAVRFHGYYESVDGMTWMRLANQPGAGLTTAACPANPGSLGSVSCPIYRGALTVQPVSGDLFALTVDAANGDQGLYQDACGLVVASCTNATVLFGTRLNPAPLEAGGGSTMIAQGNYNLALAATASGADTILYVGTIDLYRCSVAAGCALRNTTNAQNGCLNPARVAPAQHAIAASGTLVYAGNDGGIYRSTDAVNEQAGACSLDDASHFQNLNAGIGSLAEVVSFDQDPVQPGTLLAGLGALGTAGTSTVTNGWTQLSAGEGGSVAIDQASPLIWYVSAGAEVNIARCDKGGACAPADFAPTAIGAAQVAGDPSEVDAPWMIDPGMDSDLVVGTCRVWRGPGTGGALWSSANAISAPFSTPATTACSSAAGEVRSLAAGGVSSGATSAQSAGSEVVYAGMARALQGGDGGLGGHVFVTAAAQLASNTTAWRDASFGMVTNDAVSNGVFNVGGFDVSAVTVDPHDATGSTVYATVMGFSGNGVNAPHVYRSLDAGLHWTNISSNLPNAPANDVAIDPNDANTVYVAMDTGVYVTTAVTSCATGNCWSVYGIGLPTAPAIHLKAAAQMPTGDGRTGELRVGTYGRGIWEIPLLTATGAATPAITLSPPTVTYSSQAIGTQSLPVTVTVTNTGNAALAISSLVTGGDFSETDNCLGGQIVQGGSCAVQVRFAPTATRARSGTLTVYGNVAGGQAVAALSGTGTQAAAVVLTPLTLSFPATSVGATSAVVNLTIANTGGTLVNLQTQVVTGDFRISAETCGSTLGAGTSCTVSVVFAPAAAGLRSGTLSVVDDAGTQVAALSGAGTAPATDGLSPLILSFAPQQLGTASATQAVTLINAGDVALTLISAQIASADFTVVNGCGNSLNGHASCTFQVGYVPKSVGAESGALTISDQFRSQTVTLTGTGLAPPGVSLSPVGGLAFGAVGVGLTSAAQTLTLTNNGGIPLLLTSVGVSGDFGIVAGSNTCGMAVNPAGVCTVGVIFTPTSVGVRSGAVTFVDNAANSPQSVALSGTGVDFSLAVNGPATMTISSGQTATYALLLSSAAGVPGTVAFTCSGVPAHASCTVNPASVGLGGVSTVTVTVATGLATARLEMPWGGAGRAINQVAWLAVLVPVGLCWRKRRGLVLTALVLGMSGCAVGRTVPATSSPVTTYVTPSGTYAISVVGSGAGLVRQVGLTLVVQ